MKIYEAKKRKSRENLKRNERRSLEESRRKSDELILKELHRRRNTA